MNLLHKIAGGLVGAILSFAGIIIPAPVVQAPVAPLGATAPIENPVANFSTALASQISSSATTMTLVSGATQDGTTLSGTYGFTIDEGTSVQEFVRADCTNTACTALERGLSYVTGTTTIASLQFAHRRGASVKITTAPLLLNLTRIINGIGTLPNIISYTSAPSFTNSLQIIDKAYADGLVFSGAGAIAATETAIGYVELATRLEQASSTVSGTVGPLVLQARYATSTCASTASTGLNALITNNSNKLASNCLDLTSYTGQASTTQLTASSQAYLGSTTATQLNVSTTTSNFFTFLQKVFATTTAVASLNINTTAEQNVFITTLNPALLTGAVLESQTFVANISSSGSCGGVITAKWYVDSSVIASTTFSPLDSKQNMFNFKLMDFGSNSQIAYLEMGSSTQALAGAIGYTSATDSSAVYGINTANSHTFKMTMARSLGGACNYQPTWSYSQIIR